MKPKKQMKPIQELSAMELEQVVGGKATQIKPPSPHKLQNI